METPYISIIVPVYKAEKYLRRCLDSLVGQTLKNIEIIVVDDGSPDESYKIYEEYAEKDSRIKFIRKENQGPGMARNTGISEAKGQFVGFVDSDDAVLPEMYEKLYEAAINNNSELVMSGMCFVGGNIFKENEELKKKQYFSQITCFSKENIKELILGIVGAMPSEPDDSKYGVSTCKNIFSREVLEKCNVRFSQQREILSEDTVFMIDFVNNITTATGIPEAYYCYYRNEDSVSKSYKSDRFEIALKFFDLLEEKISKNISKDEYGIYLDRLIQGYGRVLCSQEIMHAEDEKISFFRLRKNLKNICENPKMRTTLKRYPWYKLPPKQGVFAFLMKYKLYLLQKYIVKLRSR